MSYVFVPAYLQLGPRKGPVRAFLVHMAEGGGTVGFLSRPNPHGVSVHYVIEYTGRIVQMVKESNASGSINPRDIRTTDDADGFYGATTAKAVMGDWWKDPNSAVISVEIEGFALTGPNGKQSAALIALVNDVRSRFPDMGLLGHRDFADYKRCPGRLIPWAALGGHGPEADMPARSFTFDSTTKAGYLDVVGAGHSYVRLADAQLYPIGEVKGKRALGPVTLVDQAGDPIGPGGPSDKRTRGYVIEREAAFMIEADVAFTADSVDETHTVTLRVDDNVVAEVSV